MRKFKYTAKFSATVKCIPSKDGKAGAISLASIDNLKGIIPQRVIDNYALLPVAFNSCVVNMGNKNGDMIDTATALRIYKNFTDSQLNTEHDRTQIIGHIVDAQLSSFDENYQVGEGSEIITEASVADSNSPFNICLAAVIYRVLGGDLEDAIETSADPASPNYLGISASWEIGFNEFSIAVGGKNLSDCEIITDADQINGYMRHVMAYGGSGKTPEGKYVFRLITGEVYPLGIGLTFSPAAAVAGIVTADKIDDDEPEGDGAPASVLNDLVSLLEKVAQGGGAKIAEALKTYDKALEDAKGVTEALNISKASETDVTTVETSILNNMPKAKFKTLAEALASNDEALAAILPELRDLIQESILQINTDWETKLNEAKSTSDTLAETKTTLENQKTDLQGQFDAIKLELDGIKATQAAAEAQSTFDQRMSDLDDKFELTDKQREIIAGEIKGLDDESYSNYIDKKVNFLVEKSVEVPAVVTSEPAAVVVEPVVPAEAIASVIQAIEPEPVVVPNSTEPSQDDWMQNLKKSFSETKISLVNRRK